MDLPSPLQDSEPLFRGIFQHADIGIAVGDLTTRRLVLANPKLAHLLGYREEELRGLDFPSLTHPDDRLQDETALSQMLRAELTHHQIERRYLCKSGEVLWAKVTVTPVAGEGGSSPTYAVALIEDLSARRRSEAAHIELVRKLEAAVSQSEQVIRALSHDLSNPLSAILAAGELILRTVPHEGARRNAQRVLTAGERMKKLIAHLVDFSRIRMGQGLTLMPGAADLADCARQIVDELEATSPGARLSLEMQGSAEGVFDDARIKQVFANVIGNAVQHAAPDSTVAVRVDGRQEERLLVTVHNEGDAIPSAIQAVLFQPFRTGAARKGERPRGLGLGLFISREIVERHGGSIAVSSAAGGTTVTIQVPRAPPA